VREAKVTKDALFEGRLTVWQPAHGTGYRTNVDAILLATFAAAGKARTAVDLGAGVGAVGLTLLSSDAAGRVTFVEKDAAVADLCRRNLKANHFEDRGDVRVVDLEEPLETTAPDVLHAAQLVVANPPYVTPARDGRRSERTSSGRMAGRRGSLAPFVRAAAAALGRRGRACFVYPAHALLELTTLARQAGLEPKRARFVHGKADRPARVVLVELAHGKPGGLVVLPALVEVDGDGKPTKELEALLKGGDADRAGDRG
jgi:tRNA1Val (adenine37-N6)-methyltransferase